MSIDHDYCRVIHHGGRDYLATSTMAEIFHAHVRDILARGDTELVPLLHSKGVDLLLITPASPRGLAPRGTALTTKKGPAGGAARPSLPDLDSNQEPAGSLQDDEIDELEERRRGRERRRDDDGNAVVSKFPKPAN